VREKVAGDTAHVRTTITETIARIRPACDDVRRTVEALLDEKTKPRGSLGRLEELVSRIAAIRGAVPPRHPRAALVVAAADHGVAAEGVSAYPQSVTAEMLANFDAGGAAACVLARDVGTRLVVVDVGVIDPPVTHDIRCDVVDGVRGTSDMTIGPAMDPSTLAGLLARGIELADELAADGIEIVAVGDMGIANTTAAGAICAALLPADPAGVCGPGTGVDDDGVRRKVDVVRRTLAVNGLDDVRSKRDPLETLASVGGLEIAYLVGVLLGAAACRMPVVLDGFVTGAAALAVARLAPPAVDSMIAATRSPEPGHNLVLDDLGLDPLLDLGLRLGEGSGAALAMSLVNASTALLSDMATFDAAGVSRA
jgi:nicotinate-nucleotide--dimethylbenzimidazole phosphoribosyltransferase